MRYKTHYIDTRLDDIAIEKPPAPQRGVWRNKNRARQLVSFHNLRWGSITPTDYDMVVDFRNIGFVIVETKLEGEGVYQGQKLAIERDCIDHERAGKKALALITTHNAPVHEDIEMSKTIVREYWYKGEWRLPDKRITCLELINQFLKDIGLEHLIGKLN